MTYICNTYTMYIIHIMYICTNLEHEISSSDLHLKTSVVFSNSHCNNLNVYVLETGFNN